MTSDTRSPNEIEREIERERAGLTDTLDDLQDRFSVEHVARQFTDQFRQHGGDIGRSVSDAVKRNPVALALTGVGLAWLMLGDKTGSVDRREPTRRTVRIDHEGRRDDTRDGDERYDRTAYAHRSTYPSGQPQCGSVGSSRRVAANPYYSGASAGGTDTPSWARDDEDDRLGVASKVSDAAYTAGGKAAGAASSAADAAQNAGAKVTDKAKGAAQAVSDAGHAIAGSAQDLASAASTRAAAARNRLAEGTENLTEEASNRVIAARQSAIEARDAAMSYARHGRDRAVDIFEDQPLIAGALAVALGAALGAALPRSRMEDAYLGEHSDQLMKDAERIFEEEKQKLGKVAKAATDEAKSIAREAKAGADDAAPADSAAQAVVDKAKASGKRIVEAAESEAKKQNVGDVSQS